MPQFKIEQTPDAVGVVTTAGAMFMKQALDSGALEEAAIEAARFEEQLADYVETRPGQPAAPGRGEAELGAIQNGLRKQIFDGFFQDALAG